MGHSTLKGGWGGGGGRGQTRQQSTVHLRGGTVGSCLCFSQPDGNPSFHGSIGVCLVFKGQPFLGGISRDTTRPKGLSPFMSFLKASICLSPLEEIRNLSSSDRFPLKPTRGKNTKNTFQANLPSSALYHFWGGEFPY